MNIDTLNTAIITGRFNNEELNTLIEAVKYARSQLTRTVKNTLSVGDTVNFTSSRNGRNVTGLVTKIAVKYVTVRTVEGLWRVPANMLTRIEDECFG